MRKYAQVPICGLPIELILLPDTATIAFVRVRHFKGIYDIGSDSVDSYFDPESFTIGENEYHYNTEYQYKEIPDMLKWLQEQKLILNIRE